MVQDKDKLTQMGISGNLKTSKIRTIFWNIYLKVLNGSQNEWASQKREQRRTYQEFKDKHNLNPHILLKAARELDNPLSQEKNSTWHKFFCDEQCKEIINIL